MKKIVILGSTGSIGTQTLDVIRANPDYFRVVGISAHENAELFGKQVREFKPQHAVLTSMSENPESALCSLVTGSEADLVINAVSGLAGLAPTYEACKNGKQIALANKESLVMAGELLSALSAQTGAKILPIDSEPSAIWQILGEDEAKKQSVERIILTASGGPFWKWRREALSAVSISQAVTHPTWKMGEKVSIDSATLMNKAFEIIEARWLFGVDSKRIDVVIHRQSVVHSLVQFSDGNMQAVLSEPDMKIPISYALFYPHREPKHTSKLNLDQMVLTFEKPDYSIFEGPILAYEALSAGGIFPAALCIADEIAVGKFLKGEISFLGIIEFIKRALEKIQNVALSMESLDELKLKLNA